MSLYRVNFTCPNLDCPSHNWLELRANIEEVQTIIQNAPVNFIDDDHRIVESNYVNTYPDENSLPSYVCDSCGHVILKDADQDQIISWLKENDMLIEKE